MLKFRLAILGAGAALALGTATAVAMESNANTNPGSHGEQVSTAAQSDTSVGDEHGATVSATASAEGQENNDGKRADAVAACRTAAASADTTEAAEPTTKAADRTEDKKEHRALVDCIAGHPTASGASK